MALDEIKEGGWDKTKSKKVTHIWIVDRIIFIFWSDHFTWWQNGIMRFLTSKSTLCNDIAFSFFFLLPSFPLDPSCIHVINAFQSHNSCQFLSRINWTQANVLITWSYSDWVREVHINLAFLKQFVFIDFLLTEWHTNPFPWYGHPYPLYSVLKSGNFPWPWHRRDLCD